MYTSPSTRSRQLRRHEANRERSTRLLREDVPETLSVRTYLVELLLRQSNESVSNLEGERPDSAGSRPPPRSLSTNLTVPLEVGDSRTTVP